MWKRLLLCHIITFTEVMIQKIKQKNSKIQRMSSTLSLYLSLFKYFMSLHNQSNNLRINTVCLGVLFLNLIWNFRTYK